jgi:predicted short-subunit dehydrogenase-like oxidoreductase (DUF2520 family)
VNRQVPDPEGVQPLKQKHIAIVGNGRVARHMIRYFELLGQPYIQWFRASSKSPADGQTSRLARYKLKLKQLVQPSRSSTLKEAVEEVNVVLILLPDDQIDSFIEQNTCLQDKHLIHFSGSLNSAYASGCHPLMTFGHELYDLNQYQSIPFVVDEGFEFKHAFPWLNNPVHTIKPEQKVLYHAMCVMAGNFSQLLWQATSGAIEQLGLPADLMNNYLLQNTKNFISNPQEALTGPFVREDVNTIEQHLAALQRHPLGPIYQSFYDLYHQPDQAIQRSQP